MNTKGNRTAVASGRSEVVQKIPAACADEARAVAFFEEARWGAEPACPRCGSVRVYQMTDKATGRRSGRWLWRCRDCKKQSTVRVGTVLEDSPIPLRHWALIFWLMCAGKKSVSAKQVQRMTGLTYKSALFAVHRARWAMADAPAGGPLSGNVEADETFFNRRIKAKNNEEPGTRKKGKHSGTEYGAVIAAQQRGGPLRAQTIQRVTAANLGAFLAAHVREDARLLTDSSHLYRKVGLPFPGGHETVNHTQREYVRGDVHVQHLEGWFSQIKRQIYGVHHAVSGKHLHRYVSESAFKWNTRTLDDGARTFLAIKRGDGRRLTRKQQTAA